MARKRSEPQEPAPYATVIVYRPNGVEYSRTPTNALGVKAVMNEAWRAITNDLGWMPDFRVIRADGTDITRFI